MKKGTLRRGRSVVDTEVRIKNFLIWIHSVLKNPGRNAYEVDKEGFVILTELSPYTMQEYGLTLPFVIFAMVRLNLIETNYFNSRRHKVIRMKWKDNLNMDDDAQISTVAQRLRAIIQAKRSTKGEIPYAEHLTSPITTVKVEPEKVIEQPEMVQQAKEPRPVPMGLKFVEEAMTAGYTVVISIPELGTEIVINKKK